MTVSAPALGARAPHHVAALDRPRRKLTSARWALLAVFVVGYLVCDRAMGPLDPSFLALTVLNTAGFALLLTRLDGPLRNTLWAWSVLFVFLTGLFLKMFWFVSKLNDPAYVNQIYPELRWINQTTVLSSYPWVTLGFVTFCIAATGALTWGRSAKRPPQPREESELIGASLHLVVVLFLAYLAATLVQVRLGYGILGVGNPSLPGGLGTLLAFFRQYVVPAALLLCLWIFDRRRRRLSRLTILLVVVVGLLNAAISTSRGVFPLTVASLLLLWVLTGRLTRRRTVIVSALALTAVLIFPILSADRYQKLTQTPGGRGMPALSTVANAAFFMVTRPTGIEGVWQSLDHRGELSLSRVLKFMRPQVITNYYTHSVVSVPRLNDNRAPGIIGALMIVGGAGAVVILMVAITLGFQLSWRVLLSLETWPVLLALAGPLVAAFMSESPDPILLAKLALQAAVCELLYRKVLRRPLARTPAAPGSPPRGHAPGVRGPSAVTGATAIPWA